jgi:hypothetical protein
LWLVGNHDGYKRRNNHYQFGGFRCLGWHIGHPEQSQYDRQCDIKCDMNQQADAGSADWQVELLRSWRGLHL